MNLALDETILIPGGTLTIFAPPVPGRMYSCGLDFSYGLEDGDADACEILDEYGDEVATLHGRWGNTMFKTHLDPVLDWYEPFIVGETQVGLDMLRALFDDGRWMYFRIAEELKGRPRRDILGHPASHVDNVILNLRKALAHRDKKTKELDPLIRVYDEETLADLSSYQFIPRKGQSLDGARDSDLSMGAPSGEHDDRVKALGYAWMGLRELPKIPKPEKKLPPGSLGAILGHDTPKPKGPVSALVGERKE